ncbi:MAG: hypothetical protein HFJ09_11120 [Lachnospiraceae bacterium]|nr:hypothetical protein [Lachnospiraceae bacterium]
MKETLEHIKKNAWSLPPEQNEKALVELAREVQKGTVYIYYRSEEGKYYYETENGKMWKRKIEEWKRQKKKH